MSYNIGEIKKHRAKKKKTGCLGYGAAALSFIPIFGVFTGIITIIWGIREWNTGGKKMVAISVTGILLMTVGLYSFLFLSTRQDLGNLQEETIKSQLLPSVIQSIEYFKLQNGTYPESLDELSASSSVPVYIFDPIAETQGETRLFFMN